MEENFDAMVENSIGEWTDEECPECKEKLLHSKDGTIWCGNCGYSNDKEFTKFFNILFK